MIDRQEAASALDMVAASRAHASELRGYAKAGSTLIAWGLVWLAGNLVAQVDPRHAPIVWTAGIVLAVVWSMTRPRANNSLAVMGSVAAGLGFVGLVVAITRAGPAAQNAIVSAFVAMSYIVHGLWFGARFALLGLVVAAIVVIGWFAFPAWLFLLLGVGGGGALIVGGLWLMRA